MIYRSVFKIFRVASVVSCFSLAFSPGAFSRNEPVTTGTLLQEMIDRNVLPEYPDPYYECRQFSSYDRGSVAPEQPGWYANRDYNQFLREENRDGRREFVLFDAEGPGAVVRFWSTLADYQGKGILRIYLDGGSEPVVEGEIVSVLSGETLSVYPLAAAVSEKAAEEYRAYNLYFPVAYASACKITYESDAVGAGEILYYNIGYRAYKKGTRVKSFRPSDTKKYAGEICAAAQTLAGCERVLPRGSRTVSRAPSVLKASDRISVALQGPAAVRKLALRIDAENYEQALRSTVLKIQFDGRETVWVPAGDFFGTGYRLSPYKTWYTEVRPDGGLTCYWVMPFRENCEITLENGGTEDVRVESFEVTAAPWKWTARSMYFGASWKEWYRLNTRRNGDFFDLNWVTLQGGGVLVGSGVTVYDPLGVWWGEGDEKVYIDGETFPSTFGTGTEDFFGYAWCRLETFEHPFIAQPRGDGNNAVGMSADVRFRSLDALPFRQSLRFDMEMWHHAETRVNYAPASYYYLRPGAVSNAESQPDAVRNPVILHPGETIGNFVGPDGYVEAELADGRVSGGTLERQSIWGIFSFNQQAWWKGAAAGDTAEFTFLSDREGRYPMKIRLTRADDYSRIRLFLNGHVCLPVFDAYHTRVETQWVELGRQSLKRGINRLKVEMLGKNPAAGGDGQMCGIDCWKFDFNKTEQE